LRIYSAGVVHNRYTEETIFTVEDVLLRLRQIESGYSYGVGFGVNYSW